MSQEVVTVAIEPVEEELLDAESLARRAQFALTASRYIVWPCGMFMVAMVIAWLFSQKYAQFLVQAVLVVPIVVGAGLYPILHRQGRVKMGMCLFLGLFLFPLAAFPIVVPQTMLCVAIWYVMLIMLGDSLLGNKDSLWPTGACILAFIADVILIDGKLVDPSWPVSFDKTVELLFSLSTSIFTLLAVTIVVRVIVVGQERYFRQSQLANWEIEKRAAIEQEQFLRAPHSDYAR